MGCLTWPFKALAFLILVAALVAAWFYRDRLIPIVRDLVRPGEAAEATGRPGADALLDARDKVDSLNGWDADSVILTAAEAASLLSEGLDPAVRRELDSMEVELGDGRISVSALLNTARIPRNLLGPFSGVIGERERITAGGEVIMAEPGLAVWDVDQLQIGSFPFPRDAVPRVVEKALGGSARGGIPVSLPEGIGSMRVRRSGVTVYPHRTER
ncbi:MAG: hypothetical protein ACREL6_06785 [Gemmatimonadales bacterium]